MAVQSLTNHKVDSAISLSDLQLLIFPNYVAFAICRAHLPAHLHAVCYRAWNVSVTLHLCAEFSMVAYSMEQESFPRN